MIEYLTLVKTVLKEGIFKENRTGVSGISYFSYNYKVDLSEGFPLLTTKKLDGKKWNILVLEFLWYLSGQEHIRELRKHTKIWDSWADQEGNLQTSYGRFWRRFPTPDRGFSGEAWANEDNKWVKKESDNTLSFDQIAYVLDTILNDPNSRRMVVDAWHPANAAVSLLPNCNYSFGLTVQEDKLNLQLVQRSGDVALGVPFNIAAYSILATALAKQTQILPAKRKLQPGAISHIIQDAHIYCGKQERAEFYKTILPELQQKLKRVNRPTEYLSIKQWVEINAPKEEQPGHDHVPGLLLQLSRTPFKKPKLKIKDKKLDELVSEDFGLEDYQSHPSIDFKIAV